MSKGITYAGDFKQKVVEDMRMNKLSYRETARKYGLPSHQQIKEWERIYLEEGAGGLYLNRRGWASAAIGKEKGGRPPSLAKKVEEDLIAENQRLRAEVDYLKN
jgi:transposase